ncbi:MAG: exodeoxyribonuclease VII large subunit [Roseburia sp.]|nr:exodeoxyribonuclease VII large subunit [Roseburia sp.]
MNRSMTVSQLSSYLKGVFDDEELLHDVTLTGEVAEVSYSDRHTFITLAEGNYSVRCIHFSSRDAIEKGVRLALRGSVDFYDKRNSVTFVYREYFVGGDGEKNAELAALKKKLYDLGYFENRPQLPKYVTNVVAVTSPDGAAIRDFIRVVHDKCPFVKIRVCPVKVQGVGAAAQMARAIDGLQNAATDAIVLCRGGGSDEDLDCFNDEALAVAVARSRIPVISAVGHEVDYTLCDFCAGTRAGTPSIAGEIVNSHAAALKTDLMRLGYTGLRALADKYEARKAALEKTGDGIVSAASARVSDGLHAVELSAHRAYYAMREKLQSRRGKLTVASNALFSAAFGLVNAKRAAVEKQKSVLSALDPHRIIGAGYAAVMLGGRAVTEAAELRTGDTVKLIFSDGIATAVIGKIHLDKSKTE